MTSQLRIAFVWTGLLAATVPQVKADEWDQKTTLTFSDAVEIPGQVLSAGTYVFKLADSASDRNVVQVFDHNEKHLYGTFLTIPDYRMTPADKPIITFEEREAGSPEAVRAWFYPGDNYGHDFVYTKARAAALARANNTPVPSMPDKLAANTTRPAQTMQEPHIREMKQTPLMAQKANQEEVEIAEVFVFPPPPVAQDVSRPMTELPQTASHLPLLGLIGVFALGSALVIRYAGVTEQRAGK